METFQPIPTDPRFQDLTGRRFNRLTVQGYAGRPGSNALWYCLCDCGNKTKSVGCSLKSGATQSCGCLGLENRVRQVRTHGKSRTPEYRIWKHMRERCENRNDKAYAGYGGRGIKVCEQWRESFEAFFADIGKRPSAKHSIDRKDNDGPYSPENCRWATDWEQRNNKRTSLRLTYRGETMTLAEWAVKLGLPRYFIDNRLRRGLSVEEAFAPPKRRCPVLAMFNATPA